MIRYSKHAIIKKIKFIHSSNDLAIPELTKIQIECALDSFRFYDHLCEIDHTEMSKDCYSEVKISPNNACDFTVKYPKVNFNASK